MSEDARRLAGAALAAALRDSRTRTLSLLGDLDDAQWQVPQRAGLNPPAWELGHVGWFAEFWTLRGPHRVDADGRVLAARPPRHAGPDEVFDSSVLPHAGRWKLALPTRGELKDRLQAQLHASLEAMPTGEDDDALYPWRLALFHEDMHAEAFTWLRATLGYAAPAGTQLPSLQASRVQHIEGGRVHIGWPSGRGGFAFDNESRGHDIELAPYAIDTRAVSAGDFLRFVEAGGYGQPQWWPGAAGEWRSAAQRSHPERWRASRRGWEARWFDRWQPLDEDQPVVHVNAWEAEAYARWSGRRLPTAAEWEHAATLGLIDWGASVWEWTSDPFGPYPGFERGPYRDYSAPWFGDHRELRGGAFATSARLHDPVYRNFFRPERHDVFAGFRTAKAP